MEDLTSKQKAVLAFIAKKIIAESLPPTIREIGAHFRFSSTGTVRNYLSSLASKGYIRLSRNKSRSIELDRAKLFRIPLVGRVVAGSPELAHENLEGYLDVAALLDMQEDLFALRVKGDSMTGAGIMPHDVVVVKKQGTYQNGDIVVALVDGEATVKRLKRSGNSVRLEGACPGYKPIIPKNDLAIIGRVISVIRRYV